MGSPVSSLVITTDRVSNKSFIASDTAGAITAFREHDVHWRVSLRDVANFGMETTCSVRATATDMKHDDTEACHRLLVSDTRGMVHLFVGEHLQMSIPTPCVINSICWVPQDSREGFTSVTGCFVLAGCDGQLYRLEGSKIVHIGSLGCSISQTFPLGNGPGAPFLCAGDFDGLLMFQHKKVVNIPLGDWVHQFHSRSDSVAACTMENRLFLMDASSLLHFVEFEQP